MLNQNPRPKILESNQPASRAAASPSSEEIARGRISKLWRPGDLFHNCSRYPRRDDVPKVDRLAAILKNGLAAPLASGTDRVVSDLRIQVTGTKIPYDSVIFLHRYGPQSGIYTMTRPGSFTLFFDPGLRVLGQKDMGANWPVLCADEVYVEGRITPDKITGIVIHDADLAGYMREFGSEFERLALPVYNLNGGVVWPPR